MNSFRDALERNPVIAAVKTQEMFKRALESPVEYIFLLSGNICELESTVWQAREAGKLLAVHFDLMEGVGKDYYAVKYLAEKLHPDAMITTKSSFVKYAREAGIFTIQRLFMLDSMSFDTGLKNLSGGSGLPDALEILPGILPEVIKEFACKTKVPVIAGGLIRQKKDAIQSLNAGAMGISTSCEALWHM